MKEPKLPPVSIEAQGSRGIGCGCLLGGIGVAFGLLLLLCVGSYFSLMHTSLPLALIKRGLEEDGKIKIEGLRGSIARGFEMDSLKFESYGPEWSELRDVKFRFNGFYDMSFNGRLIIEEASVGQGTIYAELEEPEEFSLGFDGDWAEEFAAEIKEVGDELSDEDLNELKELRIDLVSVKDLKIINPDTQLTLEIQDAQYSGFRVLKGEIANLGRIDVRSDHLDLTTSPSTVFPSADLSWRFDGRLKEGMHTKLLDDVPFDFDFALIDGLIHSQMTMFDGKLKVNDSNGEPYQLQLIDLTPQSYYQLAIPLSPSRMTFVLTIHDLPGQPIAADNPELGDQTDAGHVADAPPSASTNVADSQAGVQTGDPPSVTEDGPETLADGSATASSDLSDEEQRPNRTMQIEPGAYFYLGETKFEIITDEVQVGPRGSVGAVVLVAQADFSGEKIDATLTLLSHEPFTMVLLTTSSGTEPSDLWARLFFGEAYADLEEEQRAKVDGTLESRTFSEPVDF